MGFILKMEPPQKEDYQDKYWEDRGKGDHKAGHGYKGRKGRKGRLKFHGKGSFRDRFKRASSRPWDAGEKKGSALEKTRRGRATTSPPWMTKSNKAKSDNAQDASAAPEPAPMVTAGRGRRLTLPAWMTKGVPEAPVMSIAMSKPAHEPETKSKSTAPVTSIATPKPAPEAETKSKSTAPVTSTAAPKPANDLPEPQGPPKPKAPIDYKDL